jgi:glycosyltransferase involved in cell wall biosynthesis
MSKKRILLSNEASYLFSGYAKYGREVLSRLHKTGKYELAEFATYGKINDPRDENIPWKYYPNMPHSNDPRMKEYHSNPINQFGQWRFERVALDFKPDIVWDIRDFWMIAYQSQTPLKDYYNWCIMPTVDSAPQQPEWIKVFSKADSVFTYSDWSLDVLKKEGAGKINLFCSAPPGVDIETFKPPASKSKHKAQFGLFEDVKIVGTVMRNQKRKLFPDLMRGFRLYLDKCNESGRTELAQKTYLYLHTSYPDVGYNIPAMLKELGLGNKVLFTYYCKASQRWFPSFFQGSLAASPFTGRLTAVLPNVTNGVSEQQLADIMKLFDVYVQYAICEGFGMPQVEAASCGVPVMSVDYSAMEDVVRKLNGFPIKVKKLFRELETDAYRACPDDEDLAENLLKFLSKPEPVRQRKGFQARKGVLKHYTWDRTAKIWEKHFDETQLSGLQGQWSSSPRMVPANTNIPEKLNNRDFVDTAFKNLLGNRFDEYEKMRSLRDLNMGASFEGKSWKKFDRNDLMNHLVAVANNINNCEAARCGLSGLPEEDYIQYANIRNM